MRESEYKKEFKKIRKDEKRDLKGTPKKILRQIMNGAEDYSEYLAGRDFLVLYAGKTKELSFFAENYKHLCGVDTELFAKDFYKKALNRTLDISEIGFSNVHPMELATEKAKALCRMTDMLTEAPLIFDEINTKTKKYPFALTDRKTTLLFGIDAGKNVIVPQSLRGEDKSKTKYRQAYPVDFILYKEHNEKIYSDVAYGDPEKLYGYLSEHKIFKYPVDLEKEAEEMMR